MMIMLPVTTTHSVPCGAEWLRRLATITWLKQTDVIRFFQRELLRMGEIVIATVEGIEKGLGLENEKNLQGCPG